MDHARMRVQLVNGQVKRTRIACIINLQSTLNELEKQLNSNFTLNQGSANLKKKKKKNGPRAA